jgi:hypothetical protein
LAQTKKAAAAKNPAAKAVTQTSCQYFLIKLSIITCFTAIILFNIITINLSKFLDFSKLNNNYQKINFSANIIDMEKKMFYLLLLTISLSVIFGATIYYFYALNWIGIAAAIILTAIILFFIIHKKTSNIKYQVSKNFKISTFLLNYINPSSLIYLLFFLCTSYFIFHTKTDSALTSPWQIVDAKFFISYILASTALIWVIIKKSRFSLYLIMAHYFLSFSVLWIILEFGYGFDPFIHQATITLIDKKGSVEPKNFYYLGQYALEIFTHKIFFVPVDWADKLLVPVLASITIPSAIFIFLKKTLRSNQFIICRLSLVIALILPFSIFTLTVPQNLAYLFLLLSVFTGIVAEKKIELLLSGLLALAAFVTHPIAGIPAVLFSAALGAKKFLPKKTVKPVLALIFIFTAISLPTAFYLAGKTQNTTLIESVETPSTAVSFLSVFPKQQDAILNFVQFFSFNRWLWFSLLGLVGIIISWRERKNNPRLLISSGFSLSLLIAFILTKKNSDFSYLISYERSNFLERILILSFLFLLPGITIVFYRFIEKVLNRNNFIKISWTIFGVLLIAASLYSSYPRKDNYFNSRSFSVSKDDFAAVQWIEEDAAEKPYIVLANQQVSAAALKTFGFGRYFKENIYFYPIPTSGPLYRVYLNMVYKKADKKTALEAADLTGVKTVYFVLNKYWWAFDKIAEEAKMEAISFKNINDEIFIFKYSNEN